MNRTLSLPPLHDDITLYSIVGLIARLNGYVNGETISRDLFGSPQAGLHHDFPSNLGNFCTNTNEAYGDIEAVANRLTTLPYFLRFRESPSNTEAVHLMSGSNAERLKFSLGLPASPIGALLPLRHCPECASLDHANHGFAYWRRDHQLPSSLVCMTHGSPLLEAKIRGDGTGWTRLHLPLDEREYGAPPAPLTNHPSALLMRLAILGSKALHDNLFINDLNAIHHAYLHGLKQNGLLTPTGRIRAGEFINRIEMTYRSIADLPPFDGVLNRRAIEGLLRLVRKPRGPVNPISHLLLIDFLFGNWELFTSVLRWEQGIVVSNVVFEQSEPHEAAVVSIELQPPTELKEKLSSILRKVSEENFSLKKACISECVDINTAMRWLGKLGHTNLARRPKRVTHELRTKAVDLICSGLPLVLISKELGLSKATVDRICNESPELNKRWKNANLEWKRIKFRQAFLDAMDLIAGLSRKEIRALKGIGFSWLHQHDGSWLSEHLPKPKAPTPPKPANRRACVDWNARDNECLAAVNALGHNIQLESWERRKSQAILRRLPKLSFSPRLDRLPKSRLAVDRILGRICRQG